MMGRESEPAIGSPEHSASFFSTQSNLDTAEFGGLDDRNFSRLDELAKLGKQELDRYRAPEPMNLDIETEARYVGEERGNDDWIWRQENEESAIFIPPLVLLRAGTGPRDVYVNPGTVSAVVADSGYDDIPTDDASGDPITDKPSITCSASGTTEIYFQVNGDHEDPDFREIQDVVVKSGSSVPADALDTSTSPDSWKAHIRIGTVVCDSQGITSLTAFLSSSLVVDKCASESIVWGQG